MRSYQSTGPHWSYGWLRRTELDSVLDGYCYEAPDGDLIYSTQPDHEEIMILFEVVGDDGQAYLCDREGLDCA
jgi:hypothetical protein